MKRIKLSEIIEGYVRVISLKDKFLCCYLPPIISSPGEGVCVCERERLQRRPIREFVDSPGLGGAHLASV